MPEPTEAEHWLPIPGYEGLYEASDQGQIRSTRRMGSRGGLLKQTPDQAGYLKVKLSRENQQITWRVHQLVALTFHGPCPPGQEVRHDDGNNQNNAAANLLYGTDSDNTRDQIRHGTHKESRKERCPRCDGPYKVHSRGVTKGWRYCPHCQNKNRRERHAQTR